MNKYKNLLLSLLNNIKENIEQDNKEEEEIIKILNILEPFGDADFDFEKAEEVAKKYVNEQEARE